MARNASEFAHIINLFDGIARYRMLGLMWLDYDPWRIEGSVLAERALQLGVSRLRLVQP